MSIGLFIILGIVVGLLPLARPMGYYLLTLSLPIIGIAIVSARLWKQVYWKQLLGGALVMVLIVSVILTPWGMRNKKVFGEFQFTHSKVIMMKWHYRALRNYSVAERELEYEDYYLKK